MLAFWLLFSTFLLQSMGGKMISVSKHHPTSKYGTEAGYGKLSVKKIFRVSVSVTIPK